jgi:excisionase family DNA binding protein
VEAIDRQKSKGHNMKGQTERLTYDIEEAGRKLGVGRNKAYEAARAGQIPTIRIGKRLLVPKAAFDRLVENGSADQPGEGA